MTEKLLGEHRLGASTTVGSTTIIPVEKLVCSAGGLGGGLWLTGAVEPVAIVIVTPRGVEALDIRARELSLQDIRELVPYLFEA